MPDESPKPIDSIEFRLAEPGGRPITLFVRHIMAVGEGANRKTAQIYMTSGLVFEVRAPYDELVLLIGGRFP